MKRYTIATMLLIAALTCTTAGATTHTCVDCPDCNAKIQGANYGDVVILTADITNHDGICIEFSGKDGVTFDCGNHVISGVWKHNGYGIYLAGNSNDNTIKNCNVRDFFYGIYIFSCSNTTVQDSLFQENRYHDLYIGATTPAHCDNRLINVTGSGDRPIGLYNQSVTLQDMEFSSLYLCGADNSVLDNITIKGSDTYPNNGLCMFYTNNSILMGITSSRNYKGIYLHNANSNKLMNIKSNDNYKSGVEVWYSDDNRVENAETDSNSEHGIYLLSSSSNNLTDIRSMSNYYDGIYIYDSCSTTINNSYILNNGRYGIDLCRAESSVIYNNHLCNDENVNFFGTVYANDWNTTKTPGTNIIGRSYLGGNYWATPNGTGFSETCTDIENDGICDDCYNLEINNTDYLPLAKGPSRTMRVNENGWWIDGGQFNPSLAPVQDAIIHATAGDTIIVQDGDYMEFVYVPKRLTIRSENGSANCIVTGASSRHSVFDVTADYVNISGFTVNIDAPGGSMPGIRLHGANHCTISGNTISKNYEGISLYYSNNNTLAGNNVSSNFNHGIVILSSGNNTIYNNYFDNSRNTRFLGTDYKNYWNVTNITGPNIVGGHYIGGNYWSDYNGLDNNSDGFGDVPHDVGSATGLNIDHLPLLEPPDIRIDPTTLNFQVSAPLAAGTDATGRSMLASPPRSQPDKSIDMIIVDGRPSNILSASAVNLPEPCVAAGVDILPDVPAFDWCYGCSATAAAMMMGYYDTNGYPDMYTGPANGGVCPLNNSVWGPGECPLSATRQEFDGRTSPGHVDDYWISYGSAGLDPYIANGSTQHAWGDCTADFMGTNQGVLGCIDGTTVFGYYSNGDPTYDFYVGTGCQDGCYGMRRFVESRGYIVLENFNQRIYEYNGTANGFTFENYTGEINAGRPVIIQVTGHSLLGFGYDNSTGAQTLYVHDTCDHADHEMQWGGNYSDTKSHYGVTVMRLAPANSSTRAGVFSIIEDVGKPLAIDSITKNESWMTLDHPDLSSFGMAGYGQRAVIVRVDGTAVESDDSDTIMIGSNDPDESPYPGGVTVALCGCGDVDGNGNVNILDARLLMNHLADPDGYHVGAWAGDVDGIGGIDMADVQLLLAHMFDPDANLLSCGR